MKVRNVSITAIRGFAFAEFEPSPSINLFVGKNNSGKSTILKVINALQEITLDEFDITHSQDIGSFLLELSDGDKDFTVDKIFRNGFNVQRSKPRFEKVVGKGLLDPDYKNLCEEPFNIIYPFWSNRKTGRFEQTINVNTANSVTGTLFNLISKVDRINEDHPNYDLFRNSCEEILGFKLTTIQTEVGKALAYQVKHGSYIPLESMGEGVPNLVGLICDICTANNKIFLIEEPENDIHPEALKGLLNLIIKCSNSNQFFISSHSNVVVKMLGGYSDSKIYSITSKKDPKDQPDKLYYSYITEITDTDGRIELLRELGYDVYDSFFYDYWILLEESSAESIIKYLIDWFVPSLKHKVKTFSCRGFTNVNAKYNSLKDLFVYLHMHELYDNSIWVILDSGDKESQVIGDFHKYFKDKVNPNRFSQFSRHDFEEYYPAIFDADFQKIRLCKKDTEKKDLKKDLLKKVIFWINDNPELARFEFEKSASEVISKLIEIESELLKK